jgi:RNA polymerase sigma factor (sigma-70 family)
MTAPLALLRGLTPAAPDVDGELLRRYAETRDEAAFAELVRRNGSLVLRACRNVLRDPAAADDAFQVTFLLLARNATRLVGSPSVAGWLHTVAVRSAGKIRRTENRRRRRERSDRDLLEAGSPADEATWTEVRERIDAELARLPEEYRTPLLLCYVQGLGYADAARRLGCSLGALRGRLERGREALRRRLGRWGLPAVLVVASADAPAVGAGLRDATLAAIRSAGPVAARAALGWAKWAVAAAFAAAAGIGFAALPRAAEPPKSEPAPPPAVAAPAPEKADAGGDPLPPGALARMGSSRLHHGSNVHRLMASADGKWVISYSSSNGYRVWDLATGKEQVPIGMPAGARFNGRGQERPVQWEAAIAPAGNRVVAVVPDRKIPNLTRVLDVVTGEGVARVPASLHHVLTRPGVSSDREPEISPDGKWLLWTRGASDNNRNVKVVYAADLTAKEPKPVVFAEAAEGEHTLFGFEFSGDGKSVVMHFKDSYEVWDFETRAAKLKVPVVPNANWVGHAVISPHGKTLAVVQPMAATFQLWDVAAKKELPAVAEPFRGRVDVRAFSPDGRQVIASNPSGPLRVWDVATGKKIRDYNGPAHGAWAAAFTPDGKRIAVAQFDDVNVIDRETGKSIHDFGGHTSGVGFVGFATNERFVSSSSSGLVWDPRTGKKLGAFPGHPKGTYADAVSPDGKWIATSGADQKVRLRAAGTLEEVWVSETKGSIGYDIEFTPDGKELAVGSDKPGVRVFEVATGRQLRVVAASEVVNRLQFTPDGKRAVFRKWSDKKVRVWDWAADKEVLAFDAGKQSISDTAVSPDGRFLATADWDGFARVFDLATGKTVREFDTNPPGVREHNTNTVYAVCFSPDGRTVATGNASGTIRVWELATGGERFRLDGHRGPVLALAFSPDGRLLASGSNDRSAVTWDATGASLPTDEKHRPKDTADAWVRLADGDTAAGFTALRYLAARPAEAVPMFAKHLRPVAAADEKAVAELTEKLGSGEFAEREAAEKELAAVGDGAASQLRAAAAAAESAEVLQRLGRLLAPFDRMSRDGNRLRLVRAVEAAERAGTVEARGLLREWAGGACGAELTEAARSALGRLGKPDR